MARRPATEMGRPAAPSFSDNRKRLAQMQKIGDRFGRWRPGLQVLRRVEAVPTRYVQYDHILGVGGHPVGRITLTHGPSNEGKTMFALGLGESFLRRDHFFGFIDAERTTPLPWVQGIMRGMESHPGFFMISANTYEEVRVEIRRFCEVIGAAREKGEIDPSTTGLLVLDSIRKLYPKKLYDELMDELGTVDAKPKRGPKDVKSQLSSRAEQMKAAMNARMMDELVPLLADTNMGMVIIAREYTKADAGIYDRDWVVGGGNALFYDSSIAVRVSHSWVYDGAGDGRRTVGERHNLDIYKTKVSGKVQKVPRAHFHTSNGVLVPEGFDAPRDVLELGEQAGIVQCSGNGSYAWNKIRLGTGLSNVVKRLHSDAELFQKIQDDVRVFVAESAPREAASSGS